MELNTLYTRVLQKLKVVQPNGTGAPEDVQLVADAYQCVWAELQEMELAQWQSTAAVPTQYAAPVIDMVAFEVAEDFGAKGERYARLKSRGELRARPASNAEVRLRAMVSPKYVESTLPTEYF